MMENNKKEHGKMRTETRGDSLYIIFDDVESILVRQAAKSISAKSESVLRAFTEEVAQMDKENSLVLNHKNRRLFGLMLSDAKDQADDPYKRNALRELLHGYETALKNLFP